jgi:transposase
MATGSAVFYGMARPSLSVGARLMVTLEERSGAMAITVLGILGKNSCSVVDLDETGRVTLRRRLTRDGVVRFGAKLSACVMAMEACCGAHHLGRVLREQGHEVRLMSPQYVQP